jgi:predicted peptidase
MHIRLSTYRVTHRLLCGGLLFTLASAPAATQQLVPVSPALQELRDIAALNPLGILQMLPDSPTFARIQTRTYDFKEAGRAMAYELFVPSTYNRSRSTPLIVALHCLSAVAHDMIRYEHLTKLAEERGYIVVAPMGYNDHGWYGSRGPGRAPVVGRGGGASGDDPENLGELSELDVMNVLDLVRKEFIIDTNRIYLMGHSMGGGGTWHLGMKRPELWAALALAAPSVISSPDDLVKIGNMPVIVVQGDDDRFVKVDATRQWVEKMKSLGMKYMYIEVPGGDHMTIMARSPENMTKVFDFFDQARRRRP